MVIILNIDIDKTTMLLTLHVDINMYAELNEKFNYP